MSPKVVLIFIGCFAVSAGAVLVVRARSHEAYEPSRAARTPSNASPDPAAGVAIDVVNTVCPICGMSVDSAIPAVEYQGRRIGLGCRACPPRFAENPGLYGEAALQNRVVGK